MAKKQTSQEWMAGKKLMDDAKKESIEQNKQSHELREKAVLGAGMVTNVESGDNTIQYYKNL